MNLILMDFFRIVEDKNAQDISIIFIILFIIGLIVLSRNVKELKYLALTSIFFQIIIMIWYEKAGILWSIGLPLYHCRIIIWSMSLAVLFKLKDEFFVWLSLIGTPFSVIVLLMRDMHSYKFPHITNIYYFASHALIFLLCVGYLKQDYRRLHLLKILMYALTLNAVIQMANNLFGANYGYLEHLPLINSTQMDKFAFFIVTGILVSVVIFMQMIWEKYFIKTYKYSLKHI